MSAEFLFDLLAGAVGIGLIAAARAFIGKLPEEGRNGFAGRQRIIRELVAEIL